MSGLTDKRKRSREDDMWDSTPLSKRINQLHLTNFDETQQTTTSLHFDDPTKQIAISQLHNNNNSNHSSIGNDMNMENLSDFHNKHLMIADEQQSHQQQHQPNHHHQSQVYMQNPYDPELTEAENPFYYIKNKLLHDLHFERLKRCAV